MISKVYLRKKKISKGRVSLYLDFYPPILIPRTNRTTRRYFLNVHLPEKPKSFAEREHVKSIMQKMEIFRLRVLEQIINEKFDFYDKIVEKTDFLDYFKNESLKHNKKWIYVYQHFAAFTNNKCTFADINVALCQRFRSYLLNTAKLRDESKKLKQNSAAGYFSTFRGMLKEAYKKRMLKENINDFLDRIPEEETEINYLTEHELGLIINNECPIPVLRKAIIFACITGFRRSDILALKWEDIKELPKGGWCVFKRMQKTKNMANVPIGDDLMEVIGPRGEGLVFNGLTTYMLTYPMKRWFKSIGIKKDLHFHCTRHTYATLSLALGTDIITIKNVLGHKQESTTMRYTKVVNPLKEQAAKRLSINTISQNTEQYEKGNF